MNKSYVYIGANRPLKYDTLAEAFTSYTKLRPLVKTCAILHINANGKSYVRSSVFSGKREFNSIQDAVNLLRSIFNS